MRTTLALVLLSASLAVAGCKKKGDDAATQKPVEGSAATGSATADPAAKPADPAAKPEDPAAKPADPAAKPADPATATAKDILETAKGAGNFTTLVKAIEAAGFTTTLSGAGPFTVFAPTDEAFAKLPPKDLEALLADKAKLEAVLQYHVVPGAVASKDLATQKAIKSVQGGELAIDAASGVKIGGATVVTPDITASNGVIHAIDTVLLPPTK